MPEAGSVLAFDFGTKRIGIAIGTQLAGGRAASARPLATVDAESSDARFAAIGALIVDWQPVRLLVGRPLNDDGTPHEMTRLATKFAERFSPRSRPMPACANAACPGGSVRRGSMPKPR